jgi:UDP-N-acetylglucosamine 2-epimerase (non-hydrolysing)
VPEEVNRRVIDHCSDVLMPYTERSRANLLAEGIPASRIHVIGNPILEVIEHHDASIRRSDVLGRLGLAAGRYFLVTFHRAENVDVDARLHALVRALDALANEHGLPVVCSTHPHTRAAMARAGLAPASYPRLRFEQPFGLFDFIALERSAACVLSDSGTVQEECALLKVANVTIRDVTERPETIECGSGMLSGIEEADVLRCVRVALDRPKDWTAPAEYLRRNVSDAAVKIVLGAAPGAPSDL